MHLAFVMPPFEIYAPERGLALAIISYEVTRCLEATGVTVDVLTPTDGTSPYPAGQVVPLAYDPSAPPRSAWDRVRGRLSGWDVPGYSTYLRAVRGAIASLRRQPDAVILFNDLVTGGALEDRPGVPVLTWLQNEVTTGHRSGLRNLARTHGLLAVSSYIAERSRERYGASAPPITVLPNAVDAQRFTPSTTAPVGAGLRSCFVGRIDPNKGPLLAARAVERARAQGTDMALDVAGPVLAWGQEPEAVAAYVQELQTTLDRIGGRWVGQVSRADLPDFYRRYEIAFVPSVSPEPFGLVALEAMASGCAVIASDRGGLPEVCGEAATLVDPEDAEQLDAAIRALTSDRDLLETRRRTARIHAESRTWAATAVRLVEIVEGLK